LTYTPSINSLNWQLTGSPLLSHCLLHQKNVKAKTTTRTLTKSLLPSELKL
jgi:hypothetical protein